MKKFTKRLINTMCIVLIAITSATSISAIASTSAGIASIAANSATTTIGNVDKGSTDKYSSIFCKRSPSNIASYSVYIWVKDTTKSTVLSNKQPIIVTGTSTGHWIAYKSGVSFSKGDNIRFYGSQATASSKGMSYVIYGDKAVI